jgi:hypothetical protein
VSASEAHEAGETSETTYAARCHCGAVRFRFRSEAITDGIRCNCSICVRKGIVLSTRYYAPQAFESLEGAEALRVYQFGDHDVGHAFCATCGIHPFHVVLNVPRSYDGPARVGDRRVNLGCVDALDVLGLRIDVVDGRSF